MHTDLFMNEVERELGFVRAIGECRERKYEGGRKNREGEGLGGQNSQIK